MTDSEINSKIEGLLDRLNLKDCQDTYAGGVFTKGLSGGERKRASIGVELITDPYLLFLDEPTSGLDSENAFQILKKLKNETRLRGSAVLCTLH